MMLYHRNVATIAWSVVLTTVTLLEASRAGAQTGGRTRQSLISGTIVPGGNGTFDEFSAPILHELESIAFASTISGATPGAHQGIFRHVPSGPTIPIVRSGQPSPDGDGTFANLHFFSLSFQGVQVGFEAVMSDGDFALWRGSGAAPQLIARDGRPLPDGNGSYHGSFGIPGMDPGSQSLSFLTGIDGPGLSGHHAIIRATGGPAIVARTGQATPDGGGAFAAGIHAFGLPTSNESFGLAFRAGVMRGGDEVSTIYRKGFSADPLVEIVRSGQLAPDGRELLGFDNEVVINNAGQVAFIGIFRDDPVILTSTAGILRGSGGALTAIAYAGDPTPDGDGVLEFLDGVPMAIDMNGPAVAFYSEVQGFARFGHGIFRGTGEPGSMVQIIRQGQLAPDGNGVIAPDPTLAMNSWGTVAFEAFLGDTTGGSTENRGIFLGDGVDLVEVARKGQSMAGSTVTELEFLDQHNHGAQTGLNHNSQVAYKASLADGRDVINIFTPDLHYRAAADGSWFDAANWTLSTLPNNPHDLFIDPDTDVTVTLPSGFARGRHLTIGGGMGTGELRLAGGSFSSGVSVTENGVISGSGTLSSLRFDDKATLSIHIGGTVVGQFDQLIVNGDFDVAGSLLVNPVGGFQFGPNQEFLVTSVGTLNGQFMGLSEGDVVGNFGRPLFISYAGGDGNDILLYTVPEPGAFVLVAVSLLYLATSARRKAQRSL
jgi:hypothetical protein